MKGLILQYENGEKQKEDEPYLINYKIKEKIRYNPTYGDHRICKCGHQYYRHFDSYENNSPIGCKYCSCYEFIEKVD